VVTSGTSDDQNDGAFVFFIGGGVPVVAYKITDITDGSSNTFLLGEKHVRPEMLTKADQPNLATPTTFKGDDDVSVYSSKPVGASGRKAAQPLALGPNDPYQGQFGSWHSGVCEFAFVDGSVRAIRNGIPVTTLGLLATRSDGQAIPSID